MNLIEAYFALTKGLNEEPDNIEELLPVCLNGRWGYVDKDGEVIIKPIFNYATPFHKGLAAVFNDNEWGYIDTEGTVMYSGRYGLGRKAN